MVKRLAAIVVCIISISVLSAQGVDRTVSRSIAEYFKNYKSARVALKYSGLDRKRNNIVVNNTSKKIVIHSNEAFAGQPFTPGMIDTIYNDIEELLPKSLKKYSIEVVYGGRSIDERVPNIYRKENVDETRLWGDIAYDGLPWVSNISRPYKPSKGLYNTHLALWQSHGYYYSAEENMWKWQRPSLFCTTEDLFTQSIVVPFLMPMLENAGALVYTPRERNWQTKCVIVDNDVVPEKGRYVEDDGKGAEWKSYSKGYAPKVGAYVDGDDPFTAGTSRTVLTVQGKKGGEAVAEWYPHIPKEGEYAVYVSYCTFKNSVPDAQYTVKHSGGSTLFTVNQKMGGGTWVYLGTFHFKEGRGNGHGVSLTNISSYKGIVSADAVRFGGGMGNVERGDSLPSVSGKPRYLEAARYNLQVSGFPCNVYSAYNGESDYREDVACRSHAVNYLSGGSVYNPDTTGLNVPIELSFGFHSDAGYSKDDSLIGSLGVVTTKHNGDTLAAGLSRYISRDMVSYLLNNIKDDVEASFGMNWPVRGILDRSYSESREPFIPSVIFESLSHQNFADMQYGHDPCFKFVVARSVYKSLLKHLCHVHGKKYVVQPLPVTHFRIALSDDGSMAQLDWHPAEDPYEPTAKAKRFVVYKRENNGGYDNGTVVDSPYCSIAVEKGVQYSFKVAALNEGGESLPSEELSMFVAKKPKGTVLVVNGFYRLSGPQTVCTPDKAGFDMESDPGVPYVCTPEYCGPQLDFMRANIGFENGMGLSGNDYEGMLVAGNSFNYPYIHGKALAENGITFVSCGREAVISGEVDLNAYKVVDFILGVEKQGGKGLFLGNGRNYKTFPKELKQKIGEYCKNGGNLLVSGAFVASDMVKNTSDRTFLREVLRLDYGGTMTELSEDVIFGSGLELHVNRSVNETCYAVSRPDILVPINDAFVSFVFKGCRKSAGVAYAGDYRVLTTSFPFESVVGDGTRTRLMGSMMRFLMK